MAPLFKNDIPPGLDVPRVLLTNELVTGPPALEMLRRAGDIFASEAPVILDNACGAGVVTSLLQQQAREAGASDRLTVIASDKAPDMVALTESRAQASGWTNVKVQQFDQADIPLAESSVDHAFTNFGIFFSPNDGDALRQIHRVLRSGGVVGLTSWKAVAWWPMAQEALKAELPDAPPLGPVAGMFNPNWNYAESARKRLEDAGFEGVQVEEFKFAPSVGPDEFGEATGELVKLASTKIWDEEARSKYGHAVIGAITKYLKDTYKDGVWDGEMTALISMGKK